MKTTKTTTITTLGLNLSRTTFAIYLNSHSRIAQILSLLRYLLRRSIRLIASLAPSSSSSAKRFLITVLPRFIVDPICAPRPQDNDISAVWLTRVLRERGVIARGTEVERAEVVGLDGNRGFVGAMRRVQLSYTHKQHPTTTTASKDVKDVKGTVTPVNEDNPPSTLILKMSGDGTGLQSRKMMLATRRDREAVLYG
ncbi:hypothetical protein HK102_005894, partial [Quaeritorhiza haematococci]